MNLFRFLNPNSPTLFEQGVMINGLTSALWIERYRDAGEFTLKARVDSDLRNLLPVGTFISHVDTKEIMVVENQEVNNDRGLSSEITFTGRSFETILEQRLVGTNKEFPRTKYSPPYFTFENSLGKQAYDLIVDHILLANLLDPDDEIPYVTVLNQISNLIRTNVRAFERKDVYSQLIELLAERNLGVKVVRPHNESPLGNTNPNVALILHEGNDVSDDVILSNDLGDIKEADYFWSIRQLKNCALVNSKWFEIMIKPEDVGYDRRVMYIDLSELDDSFEEEPTGIDRDNILEEMADLGQAALDLQSEMVITNVDTTKTFGKYTYGEDFSTGDIISVIGDYNQSSKMRVIEYVIAEDKNGESRYPTLAAI